MYKWRDMYERVLSGTFIFSVIFWFLSSFHRTFTGPNYFASALLNMHDSGLFKIQTVLPFLTVAFPYFSKSSRSKNSSPESSYCRAVDWPHAFAVAAPILTSSPITEHWNQCFQIRAISSPTKPLQWWLEKWVRDEKSQGEVGEGEREEVRRKQQMRHECWEHELANKMAGMKKHFRWKFNLCKIVEKKRKQLEKCFLFSLSCNFD